MRKRIKFLIFVVIVALVFWGVTDYLESENNKAELIAQTALIQKQINHTSKLVVTEMTYAKVYTYENTRNFGWEIFDVKKKALIISEPKVQISYDLRKLIYAIDADTKSIHISFIPEPEININPNLNFYSIDDYALNRFEAKDYNEARKEITTKIKKEILNNPEIKNAQNRLLTELSSIYVLSNSLGWKLIYEENTINSNKELESVLF